MKKVVVGGELVPGLTMETISGDLSGSSGHGHFCNLQGVSGSEALQWSWQVVLHSGVG